MEPNPTVFVVDDDSAVRDALEEMIGAAGMTSEVYASAQAFLEAYDGSRPGCLISDLCMPEMGGLELQEQLNARGIEIPIIIITGHGTVPSASSSFRMGAVDFIEKPFSQDLLLDRVRAAIEKDAHARQRQVRRNEIAERVALLSVREREVMERVVRGDPNKRIALDLGITERTVEVHRSRVMEKMQATSLPELVQLVLTIHGTNNLI